MEPQLGFRHSAARKSHLSFFKSLVERVFGDPDLPYEKLLKATTRCQTTNIKDDESLLWGQPDKRFEIVNAPKRVFNTVYTAHLQRLVSYSELTIMLSGSEVEGEPMSITEHPGIDITWARDGKIWVETDYKIWILSQIGGPPYNQHLITFPMGPEPFSPLGRLAYKSLYGCKESYKVLLDRLEEGCFPLRKKIDKLEADKNEQLVRDELLNLVRYNE